jgi:hypothetical protein
LEFLSLDQWSPSDNGTWAVCVIPLKTDDVVGVVFEAEPSQRVRFRNLLLSQIDVAGHRFNDVDGLTLLEQGV